MKTFCVTAIIAVCMLLITNGTQAQTTETKLDQMELMKQFIGSWKYDSPDGSSMIFENKPFGTAMVGNTKFISKDTIFDQNKYLWGYDKKNDKIIIAEIFNNTPVMEIDVVWFTSKNIVEGVLQKDISNPENASTKFKFEFKSPDSFILTIIQNNNIAAELTWNREKK
jgi:hypothetical protein